MNKNFKILALITARGGSKGIPKKNIYPICGKPLIYYTINAALNSKFINSVYVSSDDSEILEISKGYGAIPLIRPENLSLDTTSSEAVIEHAIEELQSEKFDIILLLQPTSPLRTSEDIDNAINRFINSDATALISAFEPDHHPYKSFKLTGDGFLKGIIDNEMAFKRRQDIEKVYQSNGAIYLIYTEEFRKTKKLFTERTILYEMSKESSIDIDNLEDINKAENILKGQN